MATTSITLTVMDTIDPADLDGKLFQAHVLPDGRIRLYPATIEALPVHCPVVICGQRCVRKAGHDGKHY